MFRLRDQIDAVGLQDGRLFALERRLIEHAFDLDPLPLREIGGLIPVDGQTERGRVGNAAGDRETRHHKRIFIEARFRIDKADHVGGLPVELLRIGCIESAQPVEDVTLKRRHVEGLHGRAADRRLRGRQADAAGHGFRAKRLRGNQCAEDERHSEERQHAPRDRRVNMIPVIMLIVVCGRGADARC